MIVFRNVTLVRPAAGQQHFINKQRKTYATFLTSAHPAHDGFEFDCGSAFENMFHDISTYVTFAYSDGVKNGLSHRDIVQGIRSDFIDEGQANYFVDVAAEAADHETMDTYA